MKVIHDYPPNYELITTAVTPSTEAIYCYGNVIYNPSKKELSPDLEFHESIHATQQGDNPDAWWIRWLTERDFRLSQELEAYGEQYAYITRSIEKVEDDARQEGKVLRVPRAKLLRFGLESMASALSGESYGYLLSYGEAESKIRNYKKHLNN